MILSYKCKLITNKQQKEELKQILLFDNFICNVIATEAFKNQIFKQFDIHKLVYQNTRNEYNVGADPLIRCIAKVANAFKLNRSTNPIFKSLTIDCFKKNLNTILKSKTLNLNLKNSEKSFKFKLEIIFHPKLDLNSEIQNSFKIQLINNELYLIVFQKQKSIDKVTYPKSVGIDLGINKIATLSTGHVFGSKKLNFINRKYRKLRSKLQSKGTRSCKRKLKKLNRKISNFTKNNNHIISKKIVSIAKALNCNLVLEDLKYIRIKSTVSKAKPLIEKLNSWSFHQLRNFIEYKASLERVDFQVVKPHFSSQCCSKCGFTDKLNRQSQSCFSCIKCNFTLNADLNASINLSRKFVYASVIML